MSARADQARARRLLLLLGANLVIGSAVAWVLRDRQGAPQLPPPPARFEIPWASRLAADATELDPTCAGCNLLLISLDIFRPDHMPCFGYDKETTPYICALAEHGTVFDNFIVHAYQTPVSLMSMFTGRYPSSSGFTNFAAVLPDTTPYFPEALKAGGYSAVAMGSSFEVMSDMSAYAKGSLRFRKDGLNPGTSFGRGFDRFVFTGQRNVPTDAIPWLQARQSEPFFLWLVLGTLHWPYGAHGDATQQSRFDPPGYAGPLADDKLGFEVVSRIYQNNWYRDLGRPPVPLDEVDDAFINARYDFGMWTVDQFVGELLASIPTEVMQKTVIVLHGVHGEDLGEHGYYGHYDVFDTEVRSTLIVLSPKRKREGERVRAQVEGVDLGPTLLDLLGQPPMPGTEGVSAAPAFEGMRDPAEPAYFQRIPLWEDIFRYRSDMPAEYVSRIDPVLDRAVVGDTGMRTLRWKLIHRRARAVEEEVSWWTFLAGVPIVRPEWELYDLDADPTEQVNVADREPAVVAEMAAALLAWEARTGADVDVPHDPIPAVP